MQAQSCQGCRVALNTQCSVHATLRGRITETTLATVRESRVHPALMFWTSFSRPFNWPLDLTRPAGVLVFSSCLICLLCIFLNLPYSAPPASLHLFPQRSDPPTPHLPPPPLMEPFQTTVCHFYQPWGVLDQIRRLYCQRKKNTGVRRRGRRARCHPSRILIPELIEK